MPGDITALDPFTLREAGPEIRVDSPPTVPTAEADVAASRDPSGPHGLSAEWRPLSALEAIAEPWRALAARALEPNVFYEPAFALAAAPVFGSDASAVLVWKDTSKHCLVGFFPARIADWRSGFLLPVTLGWTHPYAPLGTPLVDRDNAAEVISAWLDFIARDPRMPRRLLLPLLSTDGAFAKLLASVLATRRVRCALFSAHRRALLAPAEDRADYLAATVSAKKRKELARQRRRLAAGEEVVTAIASSGSEIVMALDDFMTLERKGWKGRGGTAAAQDATISRFMRRAVTALADDGQAHVALLMAGPRVLAAGIVLRSGGTGWFWKIAYDEEAARSSPGVQLSYDLTRFLLDEASLARVDSCASADHPMIDALWRERLALADHLIVAGASDWLLGRTAETLRRSALGLARRLRDRLRQRHH